MTRQFFYGTSVFSGRNRCAMLRMHGGMQDPNRILMPLGAQCLSCTRRNFMRIMGCRLQFRNCAGNAAIPPTQLDAHTLIVHTNCLGITHFSISLCVSHTQLGVLKGTWIWKWNVFPHSAFTMARTGGCPHALKKTSKKNWGLRRACARGLAMFG